MPEPSRALIGTSRGAQAPAGHRDPRPVRRSPLRHLLPVRLEQVVVWQLAVLAALAWLRPIGARGITVLTLGSLAVLGTSIRFRGLCAYQWLGVAVGYRRRRGHPAVPDQEVRTHTDRAGNRVGVVEVDGGWSAVLRVNAAPTVSAADLVRILDASYRTDEVRLSAAQLVAWSAPARDRPERRWWLAVRYRPRESPQAARARGGGEIGAQRAVASAAFRLARRVDEAGHTCSVLDEGAVRDQLRDALATDPAAPVDETWHDWSADSLRQSCYRPSYGADALAALDQSVPDAAFTCVSYLLHRRSRGQVRGELVVRVASPADAEPLPAASVADALATPLDPLDGRHGPSVRATLPLALR